MDIDLLMRLANRQMLVSDELSSAMDRFEGSLGSYAGLLRDARDHSVRAYRELCELRIVLSNDPDRVSGGGKSAVLDKHFHAYRHTVDGELVRMDEPKD